MRHQATHEKIPTLPYLRQCRTLALDWLYSNYWSIQMTALEDMTASVQDLMDSLRRIPEESLKQRDYKAKQEMQKILKKIIDELSMDTFSEVLLPILGKELTRNNRVVLEDEGSPDLLRWDPLFTSCEAAWPGFSLALWEYLWDISQVKSVAKTWCLFIINRYCSTFPESDCESMVKILFERQSQDSLDLIKALEKKTGFPYPEHRYYTLTKYLQDNLAFTTLSSGSISNNVITVDNMHKDREIWKERIAKALKKEVFEINLKETESRNDGSWTAIDDWTACPIGSLPGSTDVPDLNVEGEFDNWEWLDKSKILQIPSRINIDSDDVDISSQHDPVIDTSKIILF
jgi:hypothetical protein